MVASIILNTNNNSKSFEMRETSNPSIAFFEAFIAISKMGKISGKLNTGISPLLFDALAEIADRKVNVLANPHPPSAKQSMYIKLFSALFPSNVKYTTMLTAIWMNIRTEL
jgi:hypothetical protein